MAARDAPNPEPAPAPSRGIRREVALIMGLAVTIYTVMILSTHSGSDPSFNNTFEGDEIDNWGGQIGAHLSDLLLNALGISAFVIVPLILLKCMLLYRSPGLPREALVSEYISQAMGFVLFLVASASLETLRFHAHGAVLPGHPGGVVGYSLGKALHNTVGFQGATLFMVATWLSGLLLFTGISAMGTVGAIGAAICRVGSGFAGMFNVVGPAPAEEEEEEEESPPRRREPPEKRRKARPKPEPRERIDPVMSRPAAPSPPPPAADAPAPDPAPSASPRPGRAAKPKPGARKDPDLVAAGLLRKPTDQADKIPGEAELAEMSARIEEKLRDFGVEVRVVETHTGPVITRFEIELDTGVKGNQIINLSKDLARALSVHSIRVLETIHGKTTMGLEIPNRERQTVFLSEIVQSRAFTDSPTPLALALGKDVSGSPFVADLRAMPHLLVAGTTGSGKSVSINSMVLSLIHKSPPRDVKMIMIDPKMLELSVYEGIPHLLAPVITDMEHSQAALEWCVTEMDRRYRLMAGLGVRSLGSLNDMVAQAQRAGESVRDPEGGDDDEGLDPLPYIVVIVDELADLMMVVGKKIEGLISRLAHKARASGIHLVLATQRPSVDVITGLIKANIPSRIAFQVSSKVDSRTILDQMGAETLLGKGDMLFIPISAPAPHRIHGAFVSDKEVTSVVERVKELYPAEAGSLDFAAVTAGTGDADGAPGGNGGNGERDPLYDQAVEAVVSSRRASISSVQRQLRIGYNRAARIVESMEAAGLVSAPDQMGNRKVLVEKSAD